MINDLIFKTPEQAGLSSSIVLNLIRIIEENKINLHSFMLVRHGNIIAEGYFKPFNKDFMHRLYSSSKTYVAMAVGKLIGEGKLKLTDKIADYFSDYIQTPLGKWRAETTVEDALKMSVPMLTDTYYDRKYKEWAWTFFNRQDDLKPAGTVFDYNTSASFILDVLVERITGKSFIEYLRPVFDKIGVKDIWCVKAPDGYAWGGSGVVCTMRDYAKFAELMMNKGEYKGEQLLPKDFVERATSFQIADLYENNYSGLGSEGYGYQTWITRGGFALNGMGSQFAFCFPDKDFMFVCNGDTQASADDNSKCIYSLVHYLLYEQLQDGELPENKKDYKELKQKLENLSLCTSFGVSHSKFEEKVNGKKYVLNDNVLGWKWFKLSFNGDKGKLDYENSRGVKSFDFGLGYYEIGTFPETIYYDKQVDTPANRELDAMFSAGWIEDEKLLVRAYITDSSLGNCFMTFGFKGDEVGLMLHKRAEFFMDDYAGFAGGKKSIEE